MAGADAVVGQRSRMQIAHAALEDLRRLALDLER